MLPSLREFSYLCNMNKKILIYEHVIAATSELSRYRMFICLVCLYFGAEVSGKGVSCLVSRFSKLLSALEYIYKMSYSCVFVTLQ